MAYTCDLDHSKCNFVDKIVYMPHRLDEYKSFENMFQDCVKP